MNRVLWAIGWEACLCYIEFYSQYFVKYTSFLFCQGLIRGLKFNEEVKNHYLRRRSTNEESGSRCSGGNGGVERPNRFLRNNQIEHKVVKLMNNLKRWFKISWCSYPWFFLAASLEPWEQRKNCADVLIITFEKGIGSRSQNLAKPGPWKKNFFRSPRGEVTTLRRSIFHRIHLTNSGEKLDNIIRVRDHKQSHPREYASCLHSAFSWRKESGFKTFENVVSEPSFPFFLLDDRLDLKSFSVIVLSRVIDFAIY